MANVTKARPVAGGNVLQRAISAAEAAAAVADRLAVELRQAGEESESFTARGAAAELRGIAGRLASR